MSASTNERKGPPDQYRAWDIEFLAALGRESHSFTEVKINTDDFGEGLPEVVPALWDNRNSRLISVKPIIEEFRGRPARKRGTATALTLQSFIALTNRHKTMHSAVFADTDWKKPSFVTVIDYHEKNQIAGEGGTVVSGTRLYGDPDNGKHRIRYAFPLSEEWKAWIAVNGEKIGQADFAAFLEDRITDLSAPTDAERTGLERDFSTKIATPAELIQLSRGLQVNVDTVVKNAVTLQSGEGQIQWEETHRDASGQPVKVPGLFMLSIAPFFFGDKIRIPVRLRYRPLGGKLIWFFEMHRPDMYVTERVRDDLDTVATKTELDVFEGEPEMTGG